jgi:hypothetical protein
LVVETVAVNGDHGGIADVDTPAEAVTNGGSPSPTKRPLNPGLAAANERRHAEAVARRTAPPRVAQEARNGKAGGGRPSRPPAVLPLARLVEQAWPLAAQVPPGVKITLAAGRVQLRDTNGKER